MCVVFGGTHKYLFAHLLQAKSLVLAWLTCRMRDVAAHRTRNAGACVRLTAATNDKGIGAKVAVVVAIVAIAAHVAVSVVVVYAC